MKEITAQISKNGVLAPYGGEDQETVLSEFKYNQLVRCKITSIGAQKRRSVPQLNLLMACIGLVAENSDDPKLDSKEKVKFAIKVALHFVDENLVSVRPDGAVVFHYRSFSFAELGHMEALNIFDRAFSWCANMLGVGVETMIAEAQSRMLRYG